MRRTRVRGSVGRADGVASGAASCRAPRHHSSHSSSPLFGVRLRRARLPASIVRVPTARRRWARHVAFSTGQSFADTVLLIPVAAGQGDANARAMVPRPLAARLGEEVVCHVARFIAARTADAKTSVVQAQPCCAAPRCALVTRLSRTVLCHGCVVSSRSATARTPPLRVRWRPKSGRLCS